MTTTKKTTKKTARTAGALLTGALVAAASLSLAPVANAAANDTLTPGVGLSNRLTIGMSRSTVVNTLNASHCATDAECTVPNAGSGGYTTIYFYNDQVEALEFENQSGYYTDQGVTPASTLSQVAAIYGVSVTGNVAAVPSQGYAAVQINEYLCNDTGCQVSGSHLRHIISAPGTSTRTENAASGGITLTNSSKRYKTVSTSVTVKNSAGRTVATTTLSFYLPPRGSVSYDPADLWDISGWNAGSYSYYFGKKKAAGSFSIGATEVPLY